MANTLPQKYVANKSRDPFPEIPPALLNSADIEDYAREAILLEPFSASKLKSASYEVPVSGTIYLWDPQTKKRGSYDLNKSGDWFDIRPNSIAYIHLGTTFYLPDYIAIRFNLKITHVHQGLLLGTGPLVDPGFCGKLLIPLHNLTSNSYRLEYDKGLIWVEFTKLSPESTWAEVKDKNKNRIGTYRAFPIDKTFLTPEQYFEKANHSNPIISSIPDATAKAEAAAADAARSAAEAEGRVKSLQRRIYISGIVGALALIVAMASLVYAGYQAAIAVSATVQDSVSFVRGQQLADTSGQIAVIEKEVQNLKASASNVSPELLARIARLETELEKLKSASANKKPSPIPR
jgi:deoxycytidine triphosphate deaminase